MKAGLVIVCASVCLLFSTPARAAGSDATARESRRHFQAAEAHFKAGAFDAALAAYQAGYDAKPLPGFLINIAQCQRRLGDLKSARATYQKFVMVAPDSPLVPQAKAMVEELDKLLAEIANAQPGKETTADDSQKQKQVQAPAPAQADDEPAAAAPGVTTAVPTEPAVATSAPVLVSSPSSPDSEPPAPARRRWWLWGTIGAVVVGGAVTAIVLSTGGTTTTVHDGSLGTLRR